jgi:HAMP domain-containing protein
MPTLYALLFVLLVMTAVRVLAPPSPLEELRDDATRAAASRARVALVLAVIALVWVAARCRETEDAEIRDELQRRLAHEPPPLATPIVSTLSATIAWRFR